jgi:biopolymer transport protein ExbB
MTALGLAVAVPAVMQYNWLMRRNKAIAEELGKFSNDLHGYMMSGGTVRPASQPARTGAAPAATTAGTTRPSTGPTTGATGGTAKPAGGPTLGKASAAVTGQDRKLSHGDAGRRRRR